MAENGPKTLKNTIFKMFWLKYSLSYLYLGETLYIHDPQNGVFLYNKIGYEKVLNFWFKNSHRVIFIRNSKMPPNRDFTIKKSFEPPCILFSRSNIADVAFS